MRPLFSILLVVSVLGGEPAPAKQVSAPPEPPAREGAPFSITHYSAQEYRAQPQNWSVAQDQRGLMYVANNNGILQYDGVRWRLIKIADNPDDDTFVRSVATDSQGTVYAGAVGDFGMLRPDSTATLQYVSLAQRLPTEERDFRDVWNTHSAEGGVYFQSNERLFRWDGSALRSWKSEEGFHTSFVVRGQLYVRETGRGLLRMDGDSLQLVPGGERFSDVPIFVMVPHGSEGILIGTRDEHFLLYDGQSFTSFPTQADPLLSETRLYHGCVLPGGEVALATLGGGVLIIDREGRLVQVLSPEADLPDGVVNHVYSDGQGGLWMAMHNQGVVRASVSSPLSRFGKRFGLEGIVYDLHRHAGTLYAATGAGLYRLRERRNGPYLQPHFEKVADVPAAWSLLSTGGALYAATNLGVYRVQDGRGTALVEKPAFSLAAHEGTRDRLYVGTGDGLEVLRRDRGTWTLHPLDSTKSEVRSITATSNGALWFSTLDGAVFRLSASEADGTTEDRVRARPQRFGPDDGLPKGQGFISKFQNAPVFISTQGFYRMRRSATDTSFYADTTFTGPPRHGPLRAFYGTDAGEGWFFYDNRTEIARPRPRGGYDRTAPPALQFSRGATIRALLEQKSGSAWISSRDEIFRYNADRASRLRGGIEAAPSVLIRKVADAATKAVIYGGAGRSEEPIEIPYAQNTLNVTVALPWYGGETPAEYQYRLKEDDEQWSDWTSAARTTLGNLHEGAYTFQVRARDEEGGPVSQASFTFHVLPPWYRTIWAYLLYLAGGVLLLVSYRRYRHFKNESQRAQRQDRELERERKVREQLQKANERLEAANRLKENFLANTSHEFRAPLSSIMGYAEIMQTEELPRDQQLDFLDVIRSSGNRLLNTVDMLLEISQLRAGTLDMEPSRVEINEEIGAVANSFRPKAEEKGLRFYFEPSEQPLYAQLPAVHLRRIAENLIDNAIKFTPEGAVHVAVRSKGDELCLEVRDTGVGLEPEETEQIFGEFKQASEGFSREYEGIGLGLTIAARLTRLMGGTVDVESAQGEGTLFTIRLPKRLATESPAEESPAEEVPSKASPPPSEAVPLEKVEV